MYGTTTSANSHWFTFNVGNVNTTRNTIRVYYISPPANQTLTSGQPVLIPYQMYYNVSGNYAGQLRNMYVSKSAPLGVAWQFGGTVYGYTIGYSNTTAGDAMLLQY